MNCRRISEWVMCVHFSVLFYLFILTKAYFCVIVHTLSEGKMFTEDDFLKYIFYLWLTLLETLYSTESSVNAWAKKQELCLCNKINS